MKKKLTVMLDYDDVIAVCNEKMAEIFDMSLYEIIGWGPEGKHYEDRLKMYADEDFVRNQTLRSGAKDFVIALLKRRCEVVFMTAVPANVATIRMQQISQYFPEIPPENVIIGGRKDLLNVDVMIDDNPKHILSSKAKFPILFRMPWNKDITGMLAANNYDEALNLIDTIIIQDGYAVNSSSANIACLVAPSGTGKTKIIEDLEKFGYIVPEIWTTANKVRHYYKQVPKNQFEELKDQGFFIETTSYAGEYYGIPCHIMMSCLQKGAKIVIPLDICGANALKKHYGTAVKSIYIKAPKQTLVENLLKKEINEKAKTLRILALDSEQKNEILCDDSVSVNSASEQIRRIMEE